MILGTNALNLSEKSAMGLNESQDQLEEGNVGPNGIEHSHATSDFIQILN